TLAGGTFNLGNGAAVGSGGVDLISGTVQTLAGVTITNPVTLNNSSLTVAGSNNLTLAGPIWLNNGGPPAGTFPNTPTLNTTAQTVLSGAIGGGGSLFLAGTGGTVILSGNNTYSGGTFLTGNLTTVVGSNTAFGTGTLALTTGTMLSDAAGRTLANNVV